MTITNVIADWYLENARKLPWRETKDPYKIWLSEVILQQTQIKQGLPYYMSFVDRYPTVYDLAQAREEEVLKLWQGLGYYSRARNLLKAAQKVVKQFDGVFPKNYKTLLTLPGVGDYTASAVASICYEEPVAVLDGNVFRVLARYYGIDTPINSTEGRKLFKQRAEQILDKKQPGEHNQGVMEFGALQCSPKSPNCQICPLKETCFAFQNGRVSTLPVKLKKVKIRKRYLNYLVFSTPEEDLIIRKRSKKGIWQNLYEFPLIESTRIMSAKTLSDTEEMKAIEYIMEKTPVAFYSKEKKHQLTHQILYIKFWLISVSQEDALKMAADKGYKIVSNEMIHDFPVPVVIQNFLEDFI